MTATRDTEPWEQLLDHGRADERLVHEGSTPPQNPLFTPLPDDLDPRVADALQKIGIDALYTHQRDAYDAALNDGPTIVTTGTASGKSLCFQLPTLEVLTTDPKARALYLYPTKALAQDQARAINAFGLTQRIHPAIYDGDTPRKERPQIRRRSNLVITNPDMLHVGILPHHAAWADMFANLAFVVVDEAHVYRGVFGSHVANVLRRLRRAAALYGTAPRFLLASATIANPLELARGLTGLTDIGLVDNDSAARPSRRTVIWNPPLLDEALGVRGSPLAEAAELLAELVSAGARTICFMKSRKGVELILRMASDRLPAELAERLAPYRAGYTPAQRHEIERRLVDGELLGVVATDALELGIDIGTLDAAICVTFPGTVASLRQMWGRAGRRGRGLAIYIAGEDALDQFFARHPQEFLRRPVEAAIIDPASEEIRDEHLLCAAHEAPITEADEELLGPDVLARAREPGRRRMAARARHRLRPRPRRRLPGRARRAALSLGRQLRADRRRRRRGGWHDRGGARLLDSPRGRDLPAHGALLPRPRARPGRAAGRCSSRSTVDYFTQAKRESMTYIERLFEQRETHGVTLSYGAVVYTETVLGYQRKGIQDHAVIDFQTLDLPTTEFSTRALWYELDDLIGTGPAGGPAGPPAGEAFPLELLLGSLHALEHAQIAVLPLIAMCDRWDIGGLSTNAHPQTGGPTIFIYDGHPGGIGITRRGYEQFDRLVADAQRLIGECPCATGCPSCVQSPKCGNLNDPLSKRGALELLARLTASLRTPGL